MRQALLGGLTYSVQDVSIPFSDAADSSDAWAGLTAARATACAVAMAQMAPALGGDVVLPALRFARDALRREGGAMVSEAARTSASAVLDIARSFGRLSEGQMP
jgi:hypothetical protein